MNPAKFAQMMKYLTRVKEQKPKLPDVFPASELSSPTKTKNVEEIEAINRFVRANPRQDMAGGGMLVQPGFGGTRQGYADPKDKKFVETKGASKTASGNQKVIDFLEKYKQENPGKPLDTFTLNKAVEEAYGEKFFKDKGITPAKKAGDIAMSNPQWWQKATEGLEIEFSLKGKGKANEAYKNDPEFKKFYDENYDKPWNKITVEERTIKNNALKKFNIEKQRRKVIPTESLTVQEFADRIGIKSSLLRAFRSKPKYKNFLEKMNNIFGEAFVFESGGYREVRYPIPNEEMINKFEKALTDMRLEGIENMKLKKAKPYNKAIKDVHKILQTDPDLAQQGNLSTLAQQVYGDAQGKNKTERLLDLERKMRMTAGDITRYTSFLLGTRDVEGIKIPNKDIVDSLLSDIATNTEIGKYGSSAIRTTRMKIIDGLLKTKSPNFETSRLNVLKYVQEGKHLDEIASIGGVYDIAPGYAGFAQEIEPDVNLRKANLIDNDFGRLLRKVVTGNTKGPVRYGKKDYDTIEEAVEAFNKFSKNFAKEKNIFTPTIKYSPGEVLDPNDFIPNFSRLGPEAQANILDLAKKGVGVEIKGQPFAMLQENLKARGLSITRGQRVVPPKSRTGQGGFIATELIPGVTKGSRRVIASAAGFVLPEVLFYQLDKRNRMSKGVSEEEAEAAALQSASLGALKDTAYMNNLKKVGESMGVDSRSFDAAYDMNVLLKNYEQNNLNFQDQYLNLLETGDEKRASDLEKNFNEYKKRTQNQYALLSNNISDNVMNTVGASPLIMEQGRKNITQEQFEKPFKDLQKAGLEKLKREKIKAAPTQKRQVDTTAGSIGEDFYQAFDSLTQGAKNLLQGRVIPFASKIGLPQYEPQASQREILSDTLQNLSDRDLERFNLGRGYVQSDPVSDLDLQNLAAERPGLFYAGGGIAKLAGDRSGRPPERGPNSQGLLSLMKRGMKI
jgi:hypothetical protein